MPALVGKIREFVGRSGIQVVPFAEEHVDAALDAYRMYGKGSGHGAGLNLGECFAYALARLSGEPLLCKGDDFRRTDVRLVK